jgi:hypothetical protein
MLMTLALPVSRCITISLERTSWNQVGHCRLFSLPAESFDYRCNIDQCGHLQRHLAILLITILTDIDKAPTWTLACPYLTDYNFASL